MKSVDFKQMVYIARIDPNGNPYIETSTIEDRVKQAARETTSPRGVTPIFFVENNEVRKWVSQKPVVVEAFESEKEAELCCLNYYLQDYIQNDSGEFSSDYLIESGAIVSLSEIMGLKTEVVKDLLRWSTKYRKALASRIVSRLTERFEKTKIKSGGQITKELRNSAHDIKNAQYENYECKASMLHLNFSEDILREVSAVLSK